jgi:hypothetical protein
MKTEKERWNEAEAERDTYEKNNAECWIFRFKKA